MHTVATLVCQTRGKYRKNIGNAGSILAILRDVHVTGSPPKVFKV